MGLVSTLMKALQMRAALGGRGTSGLPAFDHMGEVLGSARNFQSAKGTATEALFRGDAADANNELMRRVSPAGYLLSRTPEQMAQEGRYLDSQIREFDFGETPFEEYNPDYLALYRSIMPEIEFGQGRLPLPELAAADAQHLGYYNEGRDLLRQLYEALKKEPYVPEDPF